MEQPKMKVSHRVSCTNCCVVGCHNTYSNTDKSVKFYSFPTKPHEKQRRMQWINAVKKNNKCEGNHGQDWEPKRYSRICSKHFVGNEKSNHPHSPAFIPTIFPGINKRNLIDAERKMQRFDRYIKRTNVKKFPLPSTSSATPLVLQMPKTDGDVDAFTKKVKNIWTQVNLNINIKKYEDKGVGPNAAEDVDTGFHGLSSITTDEHLISLTGIPFRIFRYICGLLNTESHGNEKLSLNDKLLLFLMKMKLVMSYSTLGVLFSVHRSTVHRIFTSMLHELSQKMKNHVSWPAKHIASQSMPESFKINYPNCRVIIDCSEIRIQKPRPADKHIFTSSRYKGAFTAKFLIGVTPSGAVSFISKCYDGRSSDGFIANHCGILTLLEKGDLCLADNGFLGVKCEDVEIAIPPPIARDVHLIEGEVEKIYSVESVRIHVERAIQRVKTHGVLKQFTNDMLPIDEVLFMCCVLANLQASINNKNDNTE